MVTSTTTEGDKKDKNNKETMANKNVSKKDTDAKNKEESLHSLEQSLDILYQEAAPNVASKLQKGDKVAIDLAKKLPTPGTSGGVQLGQSRRDFRRREEIFEFVRNAEQVQSNDIDVALRKAVELCERFGDYEGALTKITEALKRNPASADAVATSGWVLMKQRRWKEAEQQFEELRELPSDLAEEEKFHLRNAATRGDEASKKDDDKTLKLDEYALVSAGTAALLGVKRRFTQTIRSQNTPTRRRPLQTCRIVVQESAGERTNQRIRGKRFSYSARRTRSHGRRQGDFHVGARILGD